MKNKALLLFALIFSLPVFAGEYSSLKFDEVNMRTGPGERFPIKWVYQEKHYPIEVLDRFELWRQVRDKEGEIGWMHQNMLTKNRYVLITQEATLLKKTDDIKAVAVLQPGVIAKLDRCPKGDYCRITVYSDDEKYSGWYLRSNLWGLDSGEIVED